VTVKELKEFIVHKHRGVKKISILKINTEKELNDCILLYRGSNVIVKRYNIDFVQPETDRTVSNPKTQKRENKKRKHVHNTTVQKKPRGIPKRFLVNYSAEISKDAEHLKEHCPNVKLTVRGDAQLKIS
tara:strand:- start:994 stop:1380 length:387 start_codon:yes stop_codon:yes gene_type:complete